MIDLKELTKKIKAEVADRKKRQAEIQAESEKALQEHFKDVPKIFFEKWPEVYCIFWTQYTPTWNDGEECYFRLGDFYMALTKRQFDEMDEPNYSGCIHAMEMIEKYSEDYEGQMDEYKNHPYFERFAELDKDWKEFRDFIQSFGKDALQGVFGDPAKVILSKDGVELEEDYETPY